VHVDYATQARTPKDSALAFRQFLQDGAPADEITEATGGSVAMPDNPTSKET